MKIQYELYLRTWSHLNPNAMTDRDFETIEFDPCLNYRDAVKKAKSISASSPRVTFHGSEIVQVQIAAYYEGEEAEENFGTSYALVWKETYENGVNKGRRRYML